MSKDFLSEKTRDTTPSLAPLLKKIEEEETVDFEHGRVTLMERLRVERKLLQTEYERYSTAVVDSWATDEPAGVRLRHLRVTAAALLIVWDALKQRTPSSHLDKERPLFVQGCTYAVRGIRQDMQRIREQAEKASPLSPAVLEEYRSLRNQLAVLGQLQTSSPTKQHDDSLFLEEEYVYTKPARPVEQVRESANLLELWPQLKEGVRLRIETTRRKIHLLIQQNRIAGDGRLVIEGRITLGQPDLPTHYPIRIVTEGGATPKASISLLEQERLPVVTIQKFCLEKEIGLSKT